MQSQLAEGVLSFGGGSFELAWDPANMAKTVRLFQTLSGRAVLRLRNSKKVHLLHLLVSNAQNGSVRTGSSVQGATVSAAMIWQHVYCDGASDGEVGIPWDRLEGSAKKGARDKIDKLLGELKSSWNERCVPYDYPIENCFDRGWQFHDFVSHEVALAGIIPAGSPSSVLNHNVTRFLQNAKAPPHSILRLQVLKKLEEFRKDNRSGIVLLHGPPGRGKTQIVRQWLKALMKEDPGWFESIFAWSFVPECKLRELPNRADEVQKGSPWTAKFMDAAQAHYRSLGVNVNPERNATKNGEELAKAVHVRGGLLILDSIEPFQSPPVEGKLATLCDSELKDFIDSLRGEPPGAKPWMVVATSYWPSFKQNRKCLPIAVNPLSEKQSVKLLKKIDLNGRHLKAPGSRNEQELVFARAAGCLGNEPLNLWLAATYLLRRHGGELRIYSKEGQDHIRHLAISRRKRHIKRIVDLWLDFLRTPPKGEQETFHDMYMLAFAISLFAEPVTKRDLEALAARGPGCLTNLLTRDTLRHEAIEHLANCGLLASNEYPLSLSHHLLRQHFAHHFEHSRAHTNDYELAHSALFDEFKQRAEDASDFETKLHCQERAVFHGCRSRSRIVGAFEIACEEMRKAEPGRASWQTGLSHSDDLALLTDFYLKPWSECRDGLPPEKQAELFNETGYNLQKLGRVREAIPVLKRALEIWQQPGATAFTRIVLQRNQIRELSLLIKSLVACGLQKEDASEADRLSQDAMRLAEMIEVEQVQFDAELTTKERFSNAFRCMCAYSARAWVDHRSGRATDSDEAFRKMLEIENAAAELPGGEKLRTQRMYEYSRYLIETQRFDDADKHIQRADEIARRLNLGPVPRPGSYAGDIAFNRVLLAMLAVAQLSKKSAAERRANFERAFSEIQGAHAECEKLDLQDGLMQCQLELAKLYLAVKDFDKAKKHLAMVAEFCASGRMPAMARECAQLQERMPLRKQKKLSVKAKRAGRT